MPWTKLSDDYSDDAWRLSDAAYRLHTDGLVWCNRKLLDCVLPKDEVRRRFKTPDALQELLDEDFWRESTDGTSYIIRHHAVYQRKREAVLAQQAANSANGRKGGRPPGTPREQETQSFHKAVGKSLGKSVSKPLIDPEIDPLAWTAEEFEKSRSNTGQKTEPVSELPTESETERDRTGQAFNNTSTSEPKSTGWGTTEDLDPFSRQADPDPWSNGAPRGPGPWDQPWQRHGEF
jgi:hypothetical protein